MDEDILDARKPGADAIFDLVRDVVRALDGHSRVHLDVHVHVELVAHLADEAFFDAIHSRDRLGDLPDPSDKLRAGRAIH